MRNGCISFISFLSIILFLILQRQIMALENSICAMSLL